MPREGSVRRLRESLYSGRGRMGDVDMVVTGTYLMIQTFVFEPEFPCLGRTPAGTRKSSLRNENQIVLSCFGKSE